MPATTETTMTLPCYDSRPGDAGPLTGLLRLDLRDGTWDTLARGASDGMPSEWHYCVRVPAEITSQGVAEITGDDEVRDCVATVLASYTGGHLAREALDDLRSQIDRIVSGWDAASSSLASVWSAGDWLAAGAGRCKDGQYRVAHRVLTPDTSDTALAAWAEELVAEAGADGVVISDSMEQHLRDLRERLAAEEE